jgi:hypothetical protein
MHVDDGDGGSDDGGGAVGMGRGASRRVHWESKASLDREKGVWNETRLESRTQGLRWKGDEKGTIETHRTDGASGAHTTCTRFQAGDRPD